MADWKNKLYFGDNLDILRQHVASESVDLIYLDPPFNSNTTYNVLFQEKSGERSAAQITAFKDTWHWGMELEYAHREVVTDGPKKLADLLQAMRGFLGQNDMMAYLTMMAQRMVELHRVLKATGSIYLHCDPTASHYLKLLMDAVFAPQSFRNEIAWQRTSAHSSAKRWGPNFDTLLFYTKSENYTWNGQRIPHDPGYVQRFYRHEDERGRFRLSDITAAGVRHGSSGAPWKGVNPTAVGRHWAVPAEALNESIGGTDPKGLSTQDKLDLLDSTGRIYWPSKGAVPAYKRYWSEVREGQQIQAIWHDIAAIGAQAMERLGYPTQKPEALLQRIIKASSNEGDVVLDPFCGCGTTIAVSERLGRRWIGIDITHLAIALMKRRLEDTFGADLSPYEVIGDPKDLPSAHALAEQNRHQFEWWAVDLVGARPAQDKKKGADKGVDGYINFFDDNTGKAKTIIVQVKSGGVKRGDIATLKGDLEREKAVLGVLVTLEPPTRPMVQEAAAAGFYEPDAWPGYHYPRIQILTVEELLTGKVPEFPHHAPAATFKQATRQRKEEGPTTGRLL